MTWSRSIIMLVSTIAIIALAGCAGSNGQPPETPVEQQAEASPEIGNDTEAQEEAPPPPYTGTWENGSCGTRKYTRRITFHTDDSFVAADLVAPCPPMATCVWSGVVNWQGTYAMTDDILTLDIATQAPEKPDSPVAFPKSFVVLTKDPYTIAEESSEGVTCPYSRVL